MQTNNFMPGTEIIMDEGASIIIDTGKKLHFIGCTIRGCSKM